MKDSIALTPGERKVLLDYLRRAADPQVRLRAHIILLLAEGSTWVLVGAVLFCSSRTIARWQARFQQGRVPALLGQPRGAPVRLGQRWRDLVVTWVLRQTPRAFGFLRSRWCCALVALLLERDYGLDVGRETVRRWLHKEEVVWRRPRPVLKRQDPAKATIWHGLRSLLRNLPADETVVFLDEVDVNLNPKLGCMWMGKGQQAAVATPGTTTNATWPARCTGAPACCSRPRAPSATVNCSCATSMTCAGTCGVTRRSTLYSTRPELARLQRSGTYELTTSRPPPCSPSLT